MSVKKGYKEKMKRFFYLVYVASWVTYLLLSLLSFIDLYGGEVLYISASFTVAATIRWCGYRWLDLRKPRRIRQKTVCSGSIPYIVHEEVQRLWCAFEQAAEDQEQRAAIRRRMGDVLYMRPEIQAEYPAQFSAAFCS